MAMDFKVNLDTLVVEIPLGDDTICRKIEEDENGRQYFSVPNLMNHPERSITNQHFNCRIKDVVDTIRNGDGDVLIISQPFNMERVIMFLDRNYGENIRKQFLHGWEGAEFSYVISFGRYATLNVNDNFDHDAPVHYFDSEEAAQKYLLELQNVAMQDVNTYAALDEKQKQLFLESLSTASSARQSLFFYELHKNDDPNSTCTFRVHQTVSKAPALL